jgi:4-hydroxy-4-methyl-2-oxoglutarate aldolase
MSVAVRSPAHASDHRARLDQGTLLKLARFNTPAVYNGWEQITAHDASREGINLEPLTDFMPEMGPIVGYAVTVVIEPSNPEHPRSSPGAWPRYWRYVSEQPGPKILVVQDLDRPHAFGACVGEVNSTVMRAIGCVGAIVDGAVRDLNEMRNAGFKALARQLAVGHAHGHPVRWGCPVTVFGQAIQPGQLIHADQHGFLAIPPEDEQKVLAATAFMDANECDTLIAAARQGTGHRLPDVMEKLEAAAEAFGDAAAQRFAAERAARAGGNGEWSSG